jgi:hypothetical protein
VTVSIVVDPGEIPPWFRLSSLGVHRWDGAAWHELDRAETANPLDRLTVEDGKLVVSGQTTGFSTFGAAIPFPRVRLTPDPASVSAYQRSVDLTAHVDLPKDSDLDPFELAYNWSATTANGTLFPGDGVALPLSQATYTATIPVLPDYDPIDQVTIDVWGRVDGQVTRIATATADITGDLDYVYRLDTEFSETEPGGSVALRATILDGEGHVVEESSSTTEEVEVEYDWSETGLHGSLTDPLALGPRVTYQAHSEEAITARPPRIDKIAVDMRLRILTFDEAHTALDTLEYEGSAEAFIEVENTEYDVSLAPMKKTIPKGATATFTATVDPPFEGGSLFYEFSSSEQHGSLSDFGRFTGSNSVTYTADGDDPGADQVEVTVYDVLMNKLGKATATVEVQDKEVETGAWFAFDLYAGTGDPPTCAAFGFIEWAHVEGADHYDVSYMDSQHPDRPQTFTGDHSEIRLNVVDDIFRVGDHFKALTAVWGGCDNAHIPGSWFGRFTEPEASAVF